MPSVTDTSDYSARAALNDQQVSGDKLEAIAADVLEQVDEIDLEDAYPEDQVSDIADGAVPIYTTEVFAIVPELAGYELSDPGLLGDDSADIERIAQVMIYDIMSNVASQRLYARQADAE